MSPSVPERLASIERRIREACARADRSPGEVTLLGAAKRQSDDRLIAACEAGLENLGENIVQEAEIHRRLLERYDVAWHLIGPLQSNKVRKAVELFDTVHSIDRLKIARKLDLEAGKAGKSLRGFLEVNLGEEASKHGFSAADLPRVLDETRSLGHLEIVGLMAIPPVTDSEAQARIWFRRLRELGRDLFPDGCALSMGMSADFEIAIEEGATHIRVGSDLFGPRPPR